MPKSGPSPPTVWGTKHGLYVQFTGENLQAVRVSDRSDGFPVMFSCEDCGENDGKLRNMKQGDTHHLNCCNRLGTVFLKESRQCKISEDYPYSYHNLAIFMCDGFKPSYFQAPTLWAGTTVGGDTLMFADNNWATHPDGFTAGGSLGLYHFKKIK